MNNNNDTGWHVLNVISLFFSLKKKFLFDLKTAVYNIVFLILLKKNTNDIDVHTPPFSWITRYQLNGVFSINNFTSKLGKSKQKKRDSFVTLFLFPNEAKTKMLMAIEYDQNGVYDRFYVENLSLLYICYKKRTIRNCIYCVFWYSVVYGGFISLKKKKDISMNIKSLLFTLNKCSSDRRALI